MNTETAKNHTKPDTASNPNPKPQTVAMVSAKDLPLTCPPKDAWNMHPRVFLLVNKEGKTKCPYCGARYQMVEGALPVAH